jgi:hypothetical protein
LTFITTADTFFVPLVNLPLGNIYWRVQSSRYPGAYSGSHSFLVLPDTVPILCRFNGQTIAGDTAIFRWRPVYGASYYRIQIDTNRSFSDPVTVVNLADTTFVPLVPLSPKKHFWRVSCSRNPALFAPADSLVIAVPSDIEETSARGNRPEIEIFPNPFNTTASIIWNGPHMSNGTLRIFNINGRLVFMNNISGAGTIKWNAEGLSPGLYLLKAETAGRQYFKKIIVK